MQFLYAFLGFWQKNPKQGHLLFDILELFRLDEYIFCCSPQPRPRDFTFSREFWKNILGNEDWQQKNISYIFLLSFGCMKIALCIGNTEAFIFEHVSNTYGIHDW